MTVIGQDRPGLVETVANLVTEHGGNWLESRMARLGGQFAGILRVQLPVDKEGGLLRALQGLQERGLTITAHPDTAPVPLASAKVYDLELMGQDRPGIVREISGALADFGVNVEELETECGSAAMSGETLFKAHARLSIPTEADLNAIRQTLERIAADLIVEITLAQAD
jgi:glycine cleavage system regulatory protein